MKHFDKAKRTVVIMVALCALIAQGCSDNNSANQSLAGIPLSGGNTETTESSDDNSAISGADYEQLRIETDQDNHSFAIKYIKAGKEYQLDGKLLTYGYPETANVYRIIPSYEDKNVHYNPVEGWTDCLFQAYSSLTCLIGHNSETGTEEVLSKAERNSVNDSMVRLDNADYKQMAKIRSAFPEAVFGDYTLRFTYPPTNTDLYEIDYDNPYNRRDYILDTIKGRPFDYYVTRRVIDGIIVGLPANADFFCLRYDKAMKQTTTIESEEWIEFYDGKDIYEVHCYTANKKDTEVYLKSKPVMSVEQAFDKAKPIIIERLSENKETHIYAAELVYLVVTVYDMSNEIFSDEKTTSDTYETYLYPFWVFYMHSNYKAMGSDSADRDPVIVNAITGEAIDPCVSNY
jgi:hypothetical protein